MLLTSERVRPCSARFWRSSFGRSTSSVDSSWRTVISPGISRSRLPWGPFTRTTRPSSVMSTPEGTGMGDLPMRLMGGSELPDETEDLAAHAGLASLSIGHQALAGGHHGDTQATKDPGQAVGLGVHPQAGLGHALDPGDGPGAVLRVLHADGEGLAGPVISVGHVEALDVALALEDGGERLLQLRGGHAHLVVHRHVAVADAGEHVGDRVGHRHRRITSSPW